jgi:Arc/MetJ family transcription regulator
MSSRIEVDERLLQEAIDLSHAKTKKAVVHEALAEYVRARKQPSILEQFGKLDIDPKYEYKASRRRR